MEARTVGQKSSTTTQLGSLTFDHIYRAFDVFGDPHLYLSTPNEAVEPEARAGARRGVNTSPRGDLGNEGRLSLSHLSPGGLVGLLGREFAGAFAAAQLLAQHRTSRLVRGWEGAQQTVLQESRLFPLVCVFEGRPVGRGDLADRHAAGIGRRVSGPGSVRRSLCGLSPTWPQTNRSLVPDIQHIRSTMFAFVVEQISLQAGTLD